jgi:four helix bundle protein
MKQNVVQEKSYSFAIEIVNLYKFLVEKKKEHILSRQILRSGTSIGANVEEAVGGQSRKDFISKLSIAYKEARETHYWLRILKDSGYIDERMASPYMADCEELLRIIGSIQKTIRNS